jgi:AcrR family transcriptional regulator
MRNAHILERGNNNRAGRARRKPKQRRAQQTVRAVLDAVVRILKKQGPQAVTTNRVAEVAGVSIGSLYQYFPNKTAIFVALHRRHVEEIDRLINSTLVAHADSSLDDLMRALIHAMIDAHTIDPELYESLYSEVPHRTEGTQDFATRLRNVLRLAIAARAHELKRRRSLDHLAFAVTNMVDSLSHAAALRRPANMTLAQAKSEAVRAVLAYLHS